MPFRPKHKDVQVGHKRRDPRFSATNVTNFSDAQLRAEGRLRRAVYVAPSKYSPTLEDAKRQRRQ